MSSPASLLEKAGEQLAVIQSSLPTTLAVVDLGVREKHPFVALCIRDSLLWRCEELGRCTRDALIKGDTASAVILTRALVESAAMLWRLRQVLLQRAALGPEVVSETLDRMWAPWKGDPDFPEPINIKTFITHLERDVPGAEAAYNSLSEFAHPNWNGVAGLFCSIDFEEHTARFGRDLRPSKTSERAASLLCGTLGLVEIAYNGLSDLMPSYLAELTPL